MRRTLSLVFVLVLITAFFVAALAEASPENTLPPPEIEEIIEEYQTIFRLTIHYIYLNGSTAAPTHTEQLSAGSSYSVSSPVIPGYTPTMAVVSGVMPARDVVYTVIYIPRPSSGSEGEEPVFLTIEDYETALGFGASFMHEGICIE